MVLILLYSQVSFGWDDVSAAGEFVVVVEPLDDGLRGAKGPTGQGDGLAIHGASLGSWTHGDLWGESWNGRNQLLYSHFIHSVNDLQVGPNKLVFVPGKIFQPTNVTLAYCADK